MRKIKIVWSDFDKRYRVMEGEHTFREVFCSDSLSPCHIIVNGYVMAGHENVTQTEDMRLHTCRAEVRLLWGRFGIWDLITALADEVEEDTKHIEKEFPNEARVKYSMVHALRNAAASPVVENE